MLSRVKEAFPNPVLFSSCLTNLLHIPHSNHFKPRCSPPHFAHWNIVLVHYSWFYNGPSTNTEATSDPERFCIRIGLHGLWICHAYSVRMDKPCGSCGACYGRVATLDRNSPGPFAETKSVSKSVRPNTLSLEHSSWCSYDSLGLFLGSVPLAGGVLLGSTTFIFYNSESLNIQCSLLLFTCWALPWASTFGMSEGSQTFLKKQVNLW